MASESLWNYHRDEVDEVNDNAADGTSFKTKITGKTEAGSAQLENEGDADRPTWTPVPTLNVEVTIPLKYLSNFWRALNLLLINCKVGIDLSRTKDFVFVERNNSNVTCIDFKIANTKLYDPTATFSIKYSTKVLEITKQELKKKTISWNKYRSEIRAQSENQNLRHMIDPTFRNINKLFVLLFKNGDNNPTRNSFDKYYTP